MSCRMAIFGLRTLQGTGFAENAGGVGRGVAGIWVIGRRLQRFWSLELSLYRWYIEGRQVRGIMMVLCVVLIIICFIIRAYVSYCFGVASLGGPANLPEILRSGISSLVLSTHNLIGYGISGFLGYKIQAWRGAIISVIIYYFWGSLWHKRGARSYKEGLYFYDRLSRDIKKWIHKGNLLSSKGNHKEANDAYDNALQLMSADPLHHYEKACIYALKKDKENTIKYLEEHYVQTKYKLYPTLKDFEIFRNDGEFLIFMNNLLQELGMPDVSRKIIMEDWTSQNKRF